MRSLACLLAFAVLAFTAVRASETVSPEQALELVDSLAANPVRHDTLSFAVDGLLFVVAREAPSPHGPPHGVAHLPPLSMVRTGGARDVACVPLPRAQHSKTPLAFGAYLLCLRSRPTLNALGRPAGVWSNQWYMDFVAMLRSWEAKSSFPTRLKRRHTDWSWKMS